MNVRKLGTALSALLIVAVAAGGLSAQGAPKSGGHGGSGGGAPKSDSPSGGSGGGGKTKPAQPPAKPADPPALTKEEQAKVDKIKADGKAAGLSADKIKEQVDAYLKSIGKLPATKKKP